MTNERPICTSCENPDQMIVVASFNVAQLGHTLKSLGLEGLCHSCLLEELDARGLNSSIAGDC